MLSRLARMFTGAEGYAPPAPEPSSMALGTLPRQHADLDCGRVAYLRHGSGPPLLLVHGIPTSSRLWEPLLGDLGERFDCIVPDLLGLGESVANPGADLASPGQAAMLEGLLDHLDVGEAGLALHDQGGAHGQQLLIRCPDRIRAVAFCGVVCFDNWPVPAIAATMAFAKRPSLLEALGRTGIPKAAFVRGPLRLAVARAECPSLLVDEWFGPLEQGGERLRRWLDYFGAQSNHWTIEAVPALEAWDKPALVMWAAGDAFLSPDWAVRLARAVPGAPDSPTLLPFAGHFWQCDVPREGARHLTEFFDAALVP